MRLLASVLMILATSTLLACGGGSSGEGKRSGDEEASRAGALELPSGAQAISFLGEALYPPELPEEVAAEREAQLAEALAELEVSRDDPDALIWVGRRAAYLGDYRRALDFFTIGVQTHPQDPRFLRHRGHRHITVRQPDDAIADFSLAAALIQGAEDEMEPDGQPNALGIPTSTLHFNIWYHYGLAHYLKGEFDQAVEKYRHCMEVSEHPDSKVATAHWLYMALRRAGREAEAQTLVEGMELDTLAPEVIESGSYLELLRLYAAGDREEGEGPDAESLEGATLGYGLGNWELYNGNPQRAREIFQGIVAARSQWAAFGYIAAEAELARMGQV